MSGFNHIQAPICAKMAETFSRKMIHAISFISSNLLPNAIRRPPLLYEHKKYFNINLLKILHFFNLEHALCVPAPCSGQHCITLQ